MGRGLGGLDWPVVVVVTMEVSVRVCLSLVPLSPSVSSCLPGTDGEGDECSLPPAA